MQWEMTEAVLLGLRSMIEPMIGYNQSQAAAGMLLRQRPMIGTAMIGTACPDPKIFAPHGHRISLSALAVIEAENGGWRAMVDSPAAAGESSLFQPIKCQAESSR